MAIDPRDYAKYSGRSGDPYARLGAALAGSAAQKSKNAEAKSRVGVGHSMLAYYKYKFIFGGVVVGVAVILALISKLF